MARMHPFSPSTSAAPDPRAASLQRMKWLAAALLLAALAMLLGKHKRDYERALKRLDEPPVELPVWVKAPVEPL